MSDLHTIRERNLLGAALTFTTLLDHVTIDSADLTDPRHAALWDLMASMRQNGRTIDPTTVLASLHQIPDDLRRGIDGPYLHGLYRAAPTTRNEGELAARDVTENAANRRLYAAGIRITQLAEAGGPALDNQEHARQEVDSAVRTVGDDVIFVGDTIDAFLEEADNPAPATPTGWPDLDYFIRGWKPGNLVIVGARPSVGKSLLLLQAAIHLARTTDRPVAFHSLEMTHTELTARMVAQDAEVALSRLEGRTDDPDTHLTVRDWDRIASHRNLWANLPLAVDDRPDVTVADIRAYARQVQRRRGDLAGIFVDYLQLLNPSRGQVAKGANRTEVVGAFSRSLKKLAKELQVPVIAAAQLNRGPTDRQDKRPTMADLRESGAIEQDSDVIILLHDEEDPDSPGDLDALVAKNRQGTKGVAHLSRQGEFARIVGHKWQPRIVSNNPHPAHAGN